MNRTAIALFLGSWFFLTLFHPGRPLTVDSASTLNTVRAMARGELAIPESLITREGRGGVHYSLYGPLLPLLSLPGYTVFALAETDPPGPGSTGIGWGDRAALATNQWVTALILVLLFEIGIRSGLARSEALMLALLTGVSTMLLPYGRDYFTQPLAALCLLASAYGVFGYESDDKTRGLSLASLFLGLALLARMDMAVCLPGFGFWMWKVVRSKRSSVRETLFLLTRMAIPGAVCGLALLGFDFYRWGTWGTRSYTGLGFDTPLIDSLPRFFFSPELSVFLYNPLLLASLPLFVLTWKRRRDAWIAILLSDFLYLILVSRFDDFHGGLCPGPRYLLALVPLNLLPLLIGLGQISRGRKTVLAICLVLAIPGILINGYSAVVDYAHLPSAWDYGMGLIFK